MRHPISSSGNYPHKNRITLLHTLLATSLVFATPLKALADDSAINPCAGPTALLALVDRPTVGDSVCVVPDNGIVLELGYQYQKLLHNANGYNLPEAELRVGIPGNNELVLLAPNYIHQSIIPHAGLTATTVGLKHQIGYNQTWVTAAEALLTLPSGSDAFGSKSLGGAINGIVSYNFNPSISLTCMLGIANQTEPVNSGGRRFTSINPDAVLSWTKDRLSVYGEVYGQSKTAPGEHSGFNLDTGFLYLLTNTLTFDLEVGQRISGSLGGFDHYIGTGIGISL